MSHIDLDHAPFVLLDDSRAPHRAGPSYLFHSPDYIIQADTFSDLPAALKRLDQAHTDGLHTAGWISYEAAACLEPKLAARLTQKTPEPLIWMMATRHRKQLTPQALDDFFTENPTGAQANISLSPPSHNQNAYLRALKKIHAYIQAGDVYQINHTFDVPIEISGDPLSLYRVLRESQPVAYGAYIDTGPTGGDTKILSLSPELFLKKQKDTLTAKPMKGTAPRGATAREDRMVSKNLQTDEKSRAENLMIVDLIRNDLSKIAAPHSVRVDHLFETETYPTLIQMTSSVSAQAKENLTPSQLLKAMFPCGSVTGAPKIRAMEIIHALEDGPRGVYCGTIGHFSPATKDHAETWTLNVPIRTLCLSVNKTGRFNIGSGIVADSKPDAEYDECQLKARFIQARRPPFHLIETLRLEAGNYPLLQQHIKRLEASASYFDFKCNPDQIKTMLYKNALSFKPSAIHRCRLLLDKRGNCQIESTAFEGSPYYGPHDYRVCAAARPIGTVMLDPIPVDSKDVFLRHKTSLRARFDVAFQDAQKDGHQDCLFANQEGHITEGAISNIFLVYGDQIITPPIGDGLLPGILRDQLIDMTQSPSVTIRSIPISELQKAEVILIGNALRGLRRVTLVS